MMWSLSICSEDSSDGLCVAVVFAVEAEGGAWLAFGYSCFPSSRACRHT